MARHLGERWHLPTLVVWAGPAERAMAEQIAGAGGATAQVAPPTTLPELAALARRARLFIGSDTGPLHLAAAVGTPCVGLYGPWPAARHGPYGPQTHRVAEDVLRGLHPRPPHRPGDLHGEHHDGDGLRSVRPDLLQIAKCKVEIGEVKDVPDCNLQFAFCNFHICT